MVRLVVFQHKPSSTFYPSIYVRRGLLTTEDRVPPALLLVGVTYAAASWRQQERERALAESEVEDSDARRQNALLADAYGTRSSLADLEQAIEVYESQRGRR